MSKKKKKKTPNHQNRPQKLHQAVVKLLAAEQKNTTKESSKCWDVLYEQIEQLVCGQADEVLFHALELCNDEEEFDELFHHIEVACETISVVAHNKDGEPEPDIALLFATPLICPLDGLPDALDSATLDAVTKSVRAFGFVDEVPTVMMLPELYNAQQLTELPFTHRRGVINSIINGQQPIAIAPSDLLPGVSSSPKEELCLRFLVGCVIGGDINFGCVESVEDDQVDKWADFVVDKLGYKEGAPCIVLPPMPFSESLRSAINTFNKITVNVMLMLNKSERYLDLVQCDLSIEYDDAEGRLVVTLLDTNGDRKDVVALPLPSGSPQDLDELTEMVTDSAREFHMKSIHFIE